MHRQEEVRGRKYSGTTWIEVQMHQEMVDASVSHCTDHFQDRWSTRRVVHRDCPTCTSAFSSSTSTAYTSPAAHSTSTFIRPPTSHRRPHPPRTRYGHRRGHSSNGQWRRRWREPTS